LETNDEAHRQSRQQLTEALTRVLREDKQHPRFVGASQRYFRFGISMLVLAVFTSLIGIYPVPIDLYTRVMFLMFGVILAIVGAYFVDKSNRSKPSRRAPEESEPTAPDGGLRRVK